ncbi:DUF397 domain-containing protein [Actinophytocola sp.]|uniref:DUF397 domain-containing protein n=1 Tax=Actinophytocola sp. TaxID=1872138 RepID=UPI002ED2AD7A
MPTADLTNAVWRKSSRSNGGGNECVEVAFVHGGTALRDSKNPDGGSLVLPAASWRAFLSDSFKTP